MAYPNATIPKSANQSSFDRDLRWPSAALWRPDEPAVRKVGVSDLVDAVASGWADFKAVPTHYAFLLVMYPLIGIGLYRLSFGYDVLPLVFPLLTGVTLIGTLAATWLYEISRRRERGLKASTRPIGDILSLPSIGAITRLSVVMIAIFVSWLGLSQLLYKQTMGTAVPTSLTDFLHQILSTSQGWQLMIVGNIIGFLLAVIVLMISVVSFPLLVDRNVSAATAVRTSIRAVLENPVTMALWGLFVVVALILGSIPFFVGLAVVLPVLGHATWHLYRKLVEPQSATLTEQETQPRA
jgi:uncharacterized membrane protein